MTIDQLSDRQCRILFLVAEGRQRQDIAKALGITPRTLANDLQVARDRTGLSTLQLALNLAKNSTNGDAAGADLRQEQTRKNDAGASA